MKESYSVDRHNTPLYERLAGGPYHQQTCRFPTWTPRYAYEKTGAATRDTKLAVAAVGEPFYPTLASYAIQPLAPGTA